MSLEARYNQHHSAEVIARLQNLDELEQVAAAAGHGYSQVGLQHNAGWVEVSIAENNVRPSYDLRYIRTFSPDLVKALLFDLSETRKKLAELESIVEESF